MPQQHALLSVNGLNGICSVANHQHTLEEVMRLVTDPNKLLLSVL